MTGNGFEIVLRFPILKRELRMVEHYFCRSRLFCPGPGLQEVFARMRAGSPSPDREEMQQQFENSEIIVRYNAKGNEPAGRILIEIAEKNESENTRKQAGIRFPVIVPVRYLRDLVYSGFRRFYFSGNGNRESTDGTERP